MNAEQSPQLAENKNTLKDGAKKLAVAGALSTLALLGMGGTAQAEEATPTPAVTAEASPAASTAPEASEAPTPESTESSSSTEEPSPQPSEIDEVIGTPPPVTTEGGGNPMPSPVVPDETYMVDENWQANNPGPETTEANGATLPKTGDHTGTLAATGITAVAFGAGITIAGRRKKA